MNTTDHKSEDALVTSPALQIVQEVLLIFVIVSSIFLNFSVVCVICRNKHLRKRTTNIFILNLVISNALMAIFVMPLSLATFINLGWIVQPVLCKVSSIFSSKFYLKDSNRRSCELFSGVQMATKLAKFHQNIEVKSWPAYRFMKLEIQGGFLAETCVAGGIIAVSCKPGTNMPLFP